ncbi:MAG: inositol monophosphatase [Opitutae bacterium]|nr:inositol monophosphatase [Opitutae bacterium]
MTTENNPFALACMQSGEAVEKRIRVGVEVVESQVAQFRRLMGKVESRWKADRSRVTEADLAISRQVEARILEAFPQDQFFSEETQAADAPYDIVSEYVWVIDPVDGTNNFALGMPTCAISLGLLRNGYPLYGIIYDASRDVLMRGGKGWGSWDGPFAMAPSNRTGESEFYMACDGLSSDRIFNYLSCLRGAGIKFRNYGSGALHLAYLANGLLDGSISCRVSIWDIAAAYAFCQAVGAEFHFMDDSVFPMTRFDLRAPRINYYAGTPAFCRKVERMWKKAHKGAVGAN